jgi:hypothetical protein
MFGTACTRDVALIYDQCYFRVSNTDFLSSPNNSGRLIGGNNISSDVAAYDCTLTELHEVNYLYLNYLMKVPLP